MGWVANVRTMAADTFWSLLDNAIEYLLLATVGLLMLDSVLAGPAGTSPFWASLLVTAGFAVLAVGRVVQPRYRDSIGPSVASDRISDVQSVVAILFLLLATGTILRGYALGVQSLWFDEAITANAAIALLETGQPTFPSGFTYWRAFPHTLVVAGSMALLGTGEAAARLPSVVFGLATIPVTYWLGRQVGGHTVGLVAATLLTVATWEIAWSRQARMYQLFQLLYTLSVVLLVRVEQTDFDPRTVGASIVVVVLAASTHRIGYVLVPIGAVYLGFAAVRDGRRPRWVASGIVLGSVAMLLALELRGIGVEAVLTTAATVDGEHWRLYAEWLATELNTFSVLGPAGATLLLYRGRYRASALLLLAVVPATWILSVHVELFATRYLYFGVPVLFVWTAVTVVHIAEMVVDRSVRAWRAALLDGRQTGDRPSSATLVVAAALIGLLALGGGFTVWPQAEYELGPNAPQPDFERAYAYVTDHREPDDVIVAGWTAPGLYYAGGVDYWLAHDLSGIGGSYTTNGVDRYAGAEPIRSSDRLRAVVAEHDRGWIVVDGIARERWTSDESTSIESVATVNEVGTVDDGDEIYVYAWGIESESLTGSAKREIPGPYTPPSVYTRGW
jgi:hypothetical protein